MRLKEIDIQRQCSDFLALDGWRLLRTDPVSDRRRGKGFGEIGMADCLYIRYGPILPAAEVLWVEHKRPGGKLSPHQIRWAQEETARGGLVWLATWTFEPTFEGFVAHYRASGLLRRAGL